MIDISHRHQRWTCCLVASLVVVFSSAPASANVVNGVFAELDLMAPSGQDPYTGWTSDGGIGDAPFDRDQMAVFEVGDGSDAVHLQQEFLLDANATLLTFDYRLNVTGLRDNAGTRDSFQAALYDPTTFMPLLGRDATFFPAFFSLDNDGSKFASVFTNSTVSGDVTTVQVDVSSLAGQAVVFDFLLAEDPFSSDSLITTVEIDNVSVIAAAVPEPSVVASLLMGSLVTLRYRRRRKAKPADVVG